MARQNPQSASGSHKTKHPRTARSSSPGEVRNTTDPGDETQRRFRYQHAYGVILLVASIRKKLPYVAIWCEQHEDLLGELADGHYNAYQIKTKANGVWSLTDEPLRESIRRFVGLEQQFPGRFQEFYFVSNADYEKSHARNKIARSPYHFLKAVRDSTTCADPGRPFDEGFESLRTFCGCDAESLFAVLKKLKLARGPDLDSYEAVIAHQHLSMLPECRSWPADSLAALCKELIARVSRASSLSVNDPSRHWVCLFAEDHPDLKEKRITIESITSHISKNSAHVLSMIQTRRHLSEFLEETLRLFLIDSWKKDQFARLDQAGETDPDRSTLLRQVFVDLELKPHSKPRPMRRTTDRQNLFELAELPSDLDIQELVSSYQEKPLSAMDCLLKESSSKIVIIGGPGQGKSTLGQFLAQVHRAILLNCEEELHRDTRSKTRKRKSFRPKTVRMPFRIVLKYFAQWLTDGPSLESVEAYLAEQIAKGASRPGEVSASHVQEILRCRPALIIFDGLDEVMDPDLRARMIGRIEEFLARAEELGANLQVLATSRPTGYSGQFNPQEYWHLELQPMSPEKVREYANLWTNIKVELEEEQRRVRETLQECLREEHTRWLLTTPLQVTIVLLIIKDGGRPPAQRTALFQQYWDTILRREKAKLKGMIRTADATLFNLHAYLGYELHGRATLRNVQALLPEETLTELIYSFLRADDHHSPEKALRQRVELMVQEARDRLVLLVEPEPGLFGFELRSLQEFFAGSYLAQTARDTKQRFRRFRAIARSAHWHNVALFFAGSVVLNFRGEAEKILIQGCQPVDREGPDRYLRRGAWLALDITADGIFAQNRNLQYSILEYALTVLDEVMTPRDQEHLTSALQRLSPEDRRDMLDGILKQKLNTLPLPCQPALLRTYGRFIGPQPEFVRGLEALLASNQPGYIQQALALSFQYEVDTHWLTRQLERHWQFWITGDDVLLSWMWRKEHEQYIRNVLSALALSEDRLHLLLYTALSKFRYYPVQPLPELLEHPQTLADQIILFFRCLSILNNVSIYYKHSAVSKAFATIPGMTLHFLALEEDYRERRERFHRLRLFETLDQVLKRDDLIPTLRMGLWMLYWYVHEPEEAMVTAFLEESAIWHEQELLLPLLRQRWLDRCWPLLALALECQSNSDHDTLERLRPYLNGEQEIAINRQLYAAIEKHGHDLSIKQKEEFALRLYSGVVDDMPELTSLAKRLGIAADQLIDKYLCSYTFVESRASYSAAFVQRAFAMIEGSLDQPQKIWRILNFFVDQEWSMDQETFSRGKQILSRLIERITRQHDILPAAVFLFLKLLSFDQSVFSLASLLLPTLADAKSAPANAKEESPVSMWILARVAADIPWEHLADLAHFIKDQDEKIQQGACILWEALIEAMFSNLRLPPGVTASLPNRFGTLRLDWQVGFALLNRSDAIIRKRGITLLTLSDYPVAEQNYSEFLLHAMARELDKQEITAWAFFLRNVPVDSQQSAWQALLEQILDQPRLYTTGILAAAKERYSALVGEAGPDIVGDGKEPGLPE